MDNSRTAVDCSEKGHCLHGGTAVGSLYCCKCGQYLYNLGIRASKVSSVRRVKEVTNG